MALAIPLPEADEGLPQVPGRQPIENSTPIVDDDDVDDVAEGFNHPPTCVCDTSPCPCDSSNDYY